MSNLAEFINSKSSSADFFIYCIAATSFIPQKLVDIDNSIALFTEENHESRRLSKLGMSVIYEPFTPTSIATEVKAKLADNLRRTSAISTPIADEEKSLVFSSTDRYVMIEKDKLIHASSSGNYTTLYLCDQKEVTVTKQLGKVATKLPSNLFFRVHHGHVINRGYIKSIRKKSQLLVELINKVQVPVSRRKKKEFLHWLGPE